MKFLLNTFDLNDYFEKLNKIGFINKSSRNCYEFEVLKKIGQGKIKRYSFKNGLDVSMINMKLNQELNYNFEYLSTFYEVLFFYDIIKNYILIKRDKYVIIIINTNKCLLMYIVIEKH
ncbi:hypothetical protein [Clostridium ganghwense]|uniref:hypothetical protein n=1 Tax=Clostridium ganghwense TaxID=312089 RepID=UPI00227C4D15|nr:hypothetical protein [Clostridium ganghwense]